MANHAKQVTKKSKLHTLLEIHDEEKVKKQIETVLADSPMGNLLRPSRRESVRNGKNISNTVCIGHRNSPKTQRENQFASELLKIREKNEMKRKRRK